MQSGVTGILLAGGLSQRMGSDKGLLELDGIPFAARILEALKAVCDEVMLVGATSAYESFNTPIVADIYPQKGPLGGIYTGLQHSKTDLNLIVSCDAPFVTGALLQMLLDRHDSFDITYPYDQENEARLIGVYHRELLPKLEASLTTNQLRLSHFIADQKVQRILLTDKHPFYHTKLLVNVNRPSDLAAINH